MKNLIITLLHKLFPIICIQSLFSDCVDSSHFYKCFICGRVLQKNWFMKKLYWKYIKRKKNV
jgi:hypothetical protein